MFLIPVDITELAHKPKFFWSCLDLGGTTIILPKSGWNQKWKKITIEKPFITNNFSCRNFYPIFRPEWVLAKRWLKIKPRVIHELILGHFWHQKRLWLQKVVVYHHINSRAQNVLIWKILVWLSKISLMGHFS